MLLWFVQTDDVHCDLSKIKRQKGDKIKMIPQT